MKGQATMERLLTRSMTIFLLLVGLAIPAWANHPPTTDSGADITNIGEAMNQETFWETYFGGPGYSVECTKYEGHNGSIPSSYEAAVVKSGSDWVRVYWDPPSTVIGPPNPNDAHPNRRHTAPFSWVMKCDFTETPPEEPLPPIVTSTCDSVTIDAAEGVEWAIQIGDGYVDGEGTDSFHFGKPGQAWAVYYNDQVIAEGVFEECSTTTTQPTGESSTTTIPTTTTTAQSTTSTSSLAPTSTTSLAPTTTAQSETSTSLTVLPFTGPEEDEQRLKAILLGLGIGSILAGLGLVATRRENG